jgi:zinc transporter, ZIP family
MPEFLFVLILSALPVISNFISATIAEALPLSKQTLGLALHAAAGVLLAIASTELIPFMVYVRTRARSEYSRCISPHGG